VRIAQTFHIVASPERVFDYMTDPANLRDWQTSKTRVEALSDGPPGPGFRVGEWTRTCGATSSHCPRKISPHRVHQMTHPPSADLACAGPRPRRVRPSLPR